MNFERWNQNMNDYITVSKITAEIFGLRFEEQRAKHEVRQASNNPISDDDIANLSILLNTNKDVNDVLESLT